MELGKVLKVLGLYGDHRNDHRNRFGFWNFFKGLLIGGNYQKIIAKSYLQRLNWVPLILIFRIIYLRLALEICYKCNYDASEVYIEKILGLIKTEKY